MEIVAWFFLFMLVCKPILITNTNQVQHGQVQNRITAADRQALDVDPNLADKWFLCYRNGSVQACRNHDTSQLALSRTDFQEEVLSEDAAFECRGENCINGKCRRNLCVCDEGWQGRDCAEDVNECASGTHRCSHGCHNIPGSYLCRCRDHYVAPEDQVSCRGFSYTRTTAHERHSGRIRSLRNPKPINLRSYPIQNRQKRISSTVNRIIPRRDFSAFLKVDANISAMPLPFYIAQVESSGKSAMKSINNFLAKIAILKRRFPGLTRRRKPCRSLRCEHKCVTTSPYKARCTCRRGYILEGPRSCMDLNECELEVNPCGNNSMCINSQGSYSCRCSLGYTAAAENATTQVCEDVNECLTGEHICSENGVCVNMPGFYRCECHEGYHGNGIECNPALRINSIATHNNKMSRNRTIATTVPKSSFSNLSKLKRNRIHVKASQRRLVKQRRLQNKGARLSRASRPSKQLSKLI